MFSKSQTCLCHKKAKHAEFQRVSCNRLQHTAVTGNRAAIFSLLATCSQQVQSGNNILKNLHIEKMYLIYIVCVKFPSKVKSGEFAKLLLLFTIELQQK